MALGKRAGLLIGGAAAAVAVLYALTLWSGSATPAPGETASAPTAQAAASVPVALSPQIAGRVAELESAIEAEEDPTLRLARQKELVETLATAGAFVRAAEVQEAIAEAAPSSDAWAEAGGLFLTEVLRSPDTNQAPTAARAAAAYERALEIDPANLDVKTDLATAYQYDAQNPMRSVQTLREVLDTDPDHVQANFNFGLMLAVIGRMDQAEERFQRVLDLTEHDDPIHVRADTELANLRAVAAEQP